MFFLKSDYRCSHYFKAVVKKPSSVNIPESLKRTSEELNWSFAPLHKSVIGVTQVLVLLTIITISLHRVYLIKPLVPMLT